jgi:hypothetical protein
MIGQKTRRQAVEKWTVFCPAGTSGRSLVRQLPIGVNLRARVFRPVGARRTLRWFSGVFGWLSQGPGKKTIRFGL